jgi:hypothetical protein
MRGKWLGGILEILSSHDVRGPLYLPIRDLFVQRKKYTLLFGMAKKPIRETPFRCARRTVL